MNDPDTVYKIGAAITALFWTGIAILLGLRDPLFLALIMLVCYKLSWIALRVGTVPN